MTSKKTGTYSPDGSKYGVMTDGSGNVLTEASTVVSTAKPSKGSQAPDGSIYFTLTNGSGTLI